MKFAPCGSKVGVTFLQRFAYMAASRLDFSFCNTILNSERRTSYGRKQIATVVRNRISYPDMAVYGNGIFAVDADFFDRLFMGAREPVLAQF